jgi:hypothetical protein
MKEPSKSTVWVWVKTILSFSLGVYLILREAHRPGSIEPLLLLLGAGLVTGSPILPLLEKLK